MKKSPTTHPPFKISEHVYVKCTDIPETVCVSWSLQAFFNLIKTVLSGWMRSKLELCISSVASLSSSGNT